MTTQEAINVLRWFSDWRQDGSDTSPIPPCDPTEITEAIDTVLEELEKAHKTIERNKETTMLVIKHRRKINDSKFI